MEVVARLVLAAPFLLSGVTKLADFAGAMAEVRALTGLEPAGLFAALVIAVQLGGVALLFTPRLSWLGAGLLAGFTVIATLVAHAFWTKPAAEQAMHLTIFFVNAAIATGLLLLAIHDRRKTRFER